ncbi:anti-sigma factor [Arthrobacter sp. B0490]|uniref:anti-sigma factor n=1 Tax=Arthrobacter sp. B0490 TaxID=2058891 RepID=UPI000CE513C0|nr:anti-sigma factor [Arthrobacter sp. B0490]
MQHLDPDSVGIAALDEPLDRSSRIHLDACAACGEEVAALREVVVLARSGGRPTRLEEPDPAVWDAVARELGLAGGTTPRLRSVGTLEPLGSRPAAAEPGPRRGAPEPGPAEPAATTRRPAAPGPARTSRSVPAWWLAAAAVAGIAAGGGVLWAVQATQAGGQILARADLAPLPDFGGSGEATLSESDDGVRRLDVTVSGAAPGGYREVWLLAPDATRMYSIGILDGDHGTFDVPDAIDLRQFPVVDVSDEPLDGDPTHSGVSVVRGTIDAGDV